MSWTLLRRQRPVRPHRVAPHAEWLEPRLLYSADAGALLSATTTGPEAPETRVLTATYEYAQPTATSPTAAEVRAAYALTPLQFEADAGQLGEGVDFVASGIGYAVRLGGGQAELLLDGAQETVRLELVGADAGTAVGENLLGTRSNYLVGQDSQQWATDVANYGSVRYEGVYDGVDIRYYGNQSQLEYDFIVAPGADASQLQLRFHGVGEMEIAADGDLVLRVAGTDREIRFAAPISYQQGANGRESVESHYELQADGTVRLVVGAYDTTRELIVDPVLQHASYFGEGGAETALDVAVGSDGAVYVTGQTTSSSGMFGTRVAAGFDGNEAYVAKFNADLTQLIYATRVGGTGTEEGTSIAVDAAGNAIVTGWTRSTDFAGVGAGSDQAARSGTQDAFVFKLNAAGNALVFSTYFGGSGNTDIGKGVEVGSDGTIHVAGTASGASDDAFLNKYSATGSALAKLRFGGSGADGATGLAVDAAGNAYLAGNTLSSDVAIVGGAQTTRPGVNDGFLVKYSAAGTIAYSTYIGGPKSETVTGIAADGSGRAYVIGYTKDPTQGFATTAGAFATTAYTHETGFLRIYDTTATGAGSMVYSTFVGGSKNAGGTTSGLLADAPTGIAVQGGRVAIVGYTDTADFPTTADAVRRTNTGGQSGFVMVLTPEGAGSADLVYGTYYGTGMFTGGAAWNGDRLYVVGSVTVDGLATTDGYRNTYSTGGDGVVAAFGAFPNRAPVLSGTANLPAQLEDAPAGSGTRVADLVAGTVTDNDADAVRGIAVTGVDNANGTWQYTLDGGTWLTLAAPESGSGLLLAADAATSVRFVANANYAGTASITFRAWDRTAGNAGEVVPVASTGGSSAYSSATAAATVTVTAVNDAPVHTAGVLNTVNAGEGATVSLGLGSVAYAPGGGADEAAQAITVTVTGLPASGTIQLANGTAVVSGQAYSLADLQTMRFVAGARGSYTFSFSVHDNGGTANGGQDALAQSVTLTVSNVAPVLNGTNVFTQLEDVAGNGTPVSDLIAGQVTDGGGPYGIAVTNVPNANSANGTWQYSVDGGTTWLTMAASNNNSLLLGPAARVRFLSDAGENINGDIPGFTFRAWDGSVGTSGAGFNINATGGASAFSSATQVAALTITPVNDIPVRFDVDSLSLLPAPANVTVNEGTGAVSLGLNNLEYIPGYSEEEYYSQQLSYTVTALPSASLGTIYLADGLTAVVAGAGYTIEQIRGMRFLAGANTQSGTGTFSWTIKDNAGTANGGVDTLVEAITITVRNVAPTLTGSNPLPALVEDVSANGMRVADLIANKAGDPLNSLGIAVTSAPASAGGTWEYSSNGGTSWNSLGAASATSAILLENGGQWRVRFNPGANWNGTPPGFTFRAWDRSVGSGGGTADTSVNGGTTAFSSTAVTTTVTVGAVNDAPTRTDAAGVPLAPLILLDGSPMTSLGLAGVSFGVGGGADEAGQSIVSYTITSLPSGLGTTYLADRTTEVVLGAQYTLEQIQGMQFLSSAVGALGTQSFSFAVADNGGTSNGGTNTSTFSVSVIVNRAPVLYGANSPLTVYEDFDWTSNTPAGNPPPWASAAQRAGMLVSDMISGQVFDSTGSQGGIAIVGTSGSGTWQYSLNGGNTWTNITGVSNSGALQLAADTATRLRFLPAADFNSNIGTASVTFRAWDQTVGTSGTLGDATWNGGPFAYSANTATTVVTVTPRNDAPVVTGASGGSVQEGAAPAPVVSSGHFAPGPATATDEVGQTLTVRFTSISDRVHLLLADGLTLVNVGTTYTLDQFLGMLFRSATNATPGSADVKFELQDNGGTDNGGVNKSNHTLTLTVTNRAPELNGANPLAPALEDTPGNGTLVSDIVAGQIVDPTGTRGIAVTAVDNTNGTWQYTRDGGTTWTAFGTPGEGSARLLLADLNTRVRFVPSADWNGTAGFSFAAWDGTSGAAGGVGNATVRGGGSSFSTGVATTSITVQPVNDAPVGGIVGDLTVAEDSGSTGLGLGSISYGPGGGSDEAGQSLTFVVTALPPAELGHITLADGTVVTAGDYTIDQLRGMRFVTAANAVGTASFSFVVKDNGGGNDTLVQTVNITVTAVNDPPAANTDSVDATEDTPITIAPGTLLANDTDLENDALTITGVTSGTGGTVAWSGGNIVFTPNADFHGTATFTYTVADGKGGAATGSVTVNVAPANDAPVASNDAAAGLTSVPITIAQSTLLANDTDIDGDTLTITAVGDAVNGKVTLSGSNVVFTPELLYIGAASFTYTVSDGNGGTHTATVYVTVLAGNSPPAAQADTRSTTEDVPLAISTAGLLANDTDRNSDTLTVTGVTAVVGGTVSLSDGIITFTPDADFSGAARFTYSVSDGRGGTATGTVTVDVTALNDGPVAVADALAGAEDQPITIMPPALLGNDTDVENDMLTIASVAIVAGGTVALVDGNVVFTPAANFSGTATFSYTVSDGKGGSTSGTATVEVAPVNDAPSAGNDSITTIEDAALTIAPGTLLGNDSDVDGDTLTITAVGNATGGTVALGADGHIVFSPTADFHGTGSFTYTVSDGNGGTTTATVTVTITPGNDDPAAVADTVEATEDTPLTITPATLLANDGDIDGDTLAIADVTSGTGGTVTLSGGNIVFTPDPDFHGTATFTYTVADGKGGSVTATVTVQVGAINDAPVLGADAVEATEDTPLVIAPALLLGNDSDPDGDALAIVGVANGTGGTVSWSGENIVFTPNANFSGAGSFSYTVSDGQGGSVTRTVIVNVAPVNDAPLAHADVVSTIEDEPLTIAPATLVGNDEDVENGPLTITSVNSGSGGTVRMVDGNIVFTPAPNFSGAATFTYTLSDGSGGTSTATVTVIVAPANDPPVAVGETLGADEDVPLTIAPATLLGNDTDLENDTLSIVGVADGVGGQVNIVDGQIVFTPDADFNGTASFHYTVSDGNGGTDTVLVTVVVAAVNDAPLVGEDVITGNEDTPQIIAVGELLANDGDVEGDALTVTGVTAVTGGTVTLADGVITFQPAPHFYGAAVFTYTAADGKGGFTTGTVTINVAASDDAPVANDDAVTATEDEALTITPDLLLANDVEHDGETLAIIDVGNAIGGTVAISNGNVVFTPAPDFNGTASFTYTVGDGQGGTSTATVTVTVGAVNDVPVATGEALAGTEDRPISIPLADLLANDTDADGHVLVVTDVSAVSGGTVRISEGNVVFTPTLDFSGTASFTYTISDGNGAAVTATVTITIAAVDDASTIVADAATTPEDTALDGNVLANDSDVDSTLAVATFRLAGDPLTYDAGDTVVVAGQGTLTLQADGSYTFTPVANWNGVLPTLTYTTTTGATGTLAITVAAVDDPTTANADSRTVAEEGAATGNVLDNDTDIDSVLAVAAFSVAGDATSYAPGSMATIAGVGTITIDADGRYTFTPVLNWNGTVPVVSYTTGSGATATLAITVTPADDGPVVVDDSASQQEDRDASGNVLANDSDVDSTPTVATFQVAGDARTHAAGSTVTIAGVGSFTLGGNGAFTFMPVANWNGSVPLITYTTGTGATGTLAITITAVDDPSTVGADSQSVDEDTPASGNVLENDRDLESSLSVTGFTIGGNTHAAGSTVAIPGIGTFTLGANGDYVFTPAANWNGAAPTVGYAVNTGAAGSLQVSVTPVNDAPVRSSAAAANLTVTEGSTVSLGLAGMAYTPGGAADEAGQSLVYTVTGLPSGIGRVTLADGTGVIAGASYTLQQLQGMRFVAGSASSGTGTFSFTVRDSAGATALLPERLTITLVNQAPTLSGANALPAVPENAVDPDGMLVGDLIAGQVSDPGGRYGIAVVSAAGSGGRWEFSRDAGATWSPFTGVSSADAQLLAADASTRVRFVPDADWTGEGTGLGFRAWDQSAGSAGGRADTRTNGGSSAFSIGIAGASVTVQAAAPAPGQVATPPAPSAPVAAPAPAAAPSPAPAPAVVPDIVPSPLATAAPAPAPVPQEVDLAPAPAPAGPAPMAPGRIGGVLGPVGGALAGLPQFAGVLDSLTGFAPRQVESGLDDDRVRVRILDHAAGAVMLARLLPAQGEFLVTGFAALEGAGMRITLEEFQQSLRSGAFVEELNRLRRQLREEFDLDQSTTIAVAGLSLGVSVAYILWLVRGGVLLGSYLSALPAWRLLDPLPVLARAGEAEDEEDDEAFQPDRGRGDPLRGFA